jgi:catechol 2,3-dioxygenase-like lactoylglutathione lyase family enzyme
MDQKVEKPVDKMPEYKSISPVFAVADIGETLEWYQSKLGFRSDRFPPNPPHAFAILFSDHIEIMLQRVENYQRPDIYAARPGGVWDAYIRMSEVKALYERIKDEVTIVQPLRQQPYRAWEFEVRDPNGYLLVFSEIEG